jgi:uncharacterized protein (TIGR00303 family)
VVAGRAPEPGRRLRRPLRPALRFAAAAARAERLAARWTGRTPLFACILAHTDTCLLPGVSAAGASEALRAYTPAADAEAILLGAPRCLPGLPTNPLGPPGPVGITRAAVELAGLPVEFYGAGLRVWPDVPCARVGCSPGGRIDRGEGAADARRLFARGVELGHELARRCPYLMLGESVPGGTTTALAVLLALGIDADGRVSGSVAGNAHELKSRIAAAGLRAAGLRPGQGRDDPLGAVARLGDPMQPLAAGVVVGAAEAEHDVLLAGGSQMLAVAALVAALRGPAALERCAIGTTRWVVDDPAADVAGLAADVWPGLPLLAVNLDFARSRHPGLRRYEEWLVKEGAGAGGACIAAILATGLGIEALEAAIDAAYD